MRWMILSVWMVFILGCKPSIYLQRSTVQLSKPIINVSNVFFESSTQITIEPTAKNAKILYGKDNDGAQKYVSPIVVNESSKISAQAVGGGYISSDSTNVEVVKLPKNEIISITSERELNEKYGKGGLDILINRRKGKVDFNNGWLGYSGDTVVYDLEFDIIELDYLLISTLRNQGAWIFEPAAINIYAKGNRIGSLYPNDILLEKDNANVFTKIEVSNISTKNLRVEIIAPKRLPDWHPGSGNKPWIFIDEILVY